MKLHRLFFAATLLLSLQGCPSTPGEKLDDNIDDALDRRPGEKIRDAVEDIKD